MMERKQMMLVDKRAINLLFKEGNSVKSFPLVMYSMNSLTSKVLFSIPKKINNSAVARNKIKRALKAIYFEDLSLENHNKRNKTIAFVYISSSKINHNELRIKMEKLLDSL
jgi:ribonuclease P protein component